MLANERWPLWQVVRWLNNWFDGLGAEGERTHWSNADQESLIYFSEW
jgi:hypothetical protein